MISTTVSIKEIANGMVAKHDQSKTMLFFLAKGRNKCTNQSREKAQRREIENVSIQASSRPY